MFDFIPNERFRGIKVNDVSLTENSFSYFKEDRSAHIASYEMFGK